MNINPCGEIKNIVLETVNVRDRIDSSGIKV